MTGEETVAVLLKALPVDVLDTLMKRLSPDKVEKLRARLESVRQKPTGTERLDGALEILKKLAAARAAGIDPKTSEALGKINGGYRLGKVGESKEGDSDKPRVKPVEKLQLADEIEVPVSIHHLRDIPPDLLVRVLLDEQVPTLAMVMSVVDPKVAMEVMKRLPAEKRPDLAVRLTQPVASNPELVELLAQAVVQKAIKLASAPTEPTGDDRIRNLATMLRGLKRDERLSIIEALNVADAIACNKVKELLYLFEDILRIEDRALQLVLVELDTPTLAMALSGVAEELKTKVVKNMSSRAQSMLNEESGLLGNVPPAKVQQAQTKIIGILRRFEEEGKLTIEV
ncbi:FliG C-terminal domain-containing protein [Zavarzinella formosa]|uniref:FliG C-terminal domain-containing protein n=1 Tax=Zavarzinella formosa TaxID=360055 RepID=UPI0002DA16D7|nr:FliG C-terminal domain-containing protein [Zavarzinella formosa]